MSILHDLLIRQYEASLSMLAHCVALCPAETWNAPVVRYPFSQVVFHTLFFADFYLCASPDDFVSQQFHEENAAFFAEYEQLLDREPVTVYERSTIERYLQFVRGKATATVTAESEAELAAPTRFPRRSGSRAEGHVYNIRHIQHHIGQLSMRLRIDWSADVPWIGHEWRIPPQA